jgi:hypothetical protein
LTPSIFSSGTSFREGESKQWWSMTIVTWALTLNDTEVTGFSDPSDNRIQCFADDVERKRPVFDQRQRIYHTKSKTLFRSETISYYNRFLSGFVISFSHFSFDVYTFFSELRVRLFSLFRCFSYIFIRFPNQETTTNLNIYVSFFLKQVEKTFTLFRNIMIKRFFRNSSSVPEIQAHIFPYPELVIHAVSCLDPRALKTKEQRATSWEFHVSISSSSVNSSIPCLFTFIQILFLCRLNLGMCVFL